MIRRFGLLLGLLAPLLLIAPLLWAQDQHSDNLLSPTRGAVLVSAPGDPNLALALTDDDDTSLWGIDAPTLPPPYQFVFELPAMARLAQVGVNGAGDTPDGIPGASARVLRVEASVTGPDGPYLPLATLTAAAQGRTLADVTQPGGFRWLRFTLQTAQSDSAARIYLDAVIALGTLNPRPQAPRFTGTFQTGHQDHISLRQDGTALHGCYLENGGRSGGTLSGTVQDGVARVSWRSDQGIAGTALLTRDSTGALAGVRYRQRSRALWGGPMVASAPTGQTCAIAAPASQLRDATNPILQALGTDGVARIYGIQFRYGRDTPDTRSQPALQQLLVALTAAPDLVVQVEGHTDADGSDAYNLALSQRRAQAVVDWLVAQGIAAERLTALGKGESEPVASNATRDGKALNRRVELRLR